MISAVLIKKVCQYKIFIFKHRGFLQIFRFFIGYEGDRGIRIFIEYLLARHPDTVLEIEIAFEFNKSFQF